VTEVRGQRSSDKDPMADDGQTSGENADIEAIRDIDANLVVQESLTARHKRTLMIRPPGSAGLAVHQPRYEGT